MSSMAAAANRRGYILTASVLLVMMLGGTLPVPLYVLYEKQMDFGVLGVTVVFAAYVLGTLVVLVAFGDLSDHLGRRATLAIAVACAMVSTALFLAASGIGLLIVARLVSGAAAGLATSTATAALAELQPLGDRRAYVPPDAAPGQRVTPRQGKGCLMRHCHQAGWRAGELLGHRGAIYMTQIYVTAI
jgi:MFS family permease